MKPRNFLSLFSQLALFLSLASAAHAAEPAPAEAEKLLGRLIEAVKAES